MHGMPVAYSPRRGLRGFPTVSRPGSGRTRICLFWDPLGRSGRAQMLLREHGITPIDMRAIDEHGVGAPLSAFLARVAAAGGMLHVSLDVDFLDPEIAPAVGTTVPGGATFREAHLIMEMLHERAWPARSTWSSSTRSSTSAARTARLMTDLTASLLGRRVLDRPTQRLSSRRIPFP
jgi:arginase